jgi:GT2 family glycosyltransferase
VTSAALPTLSVVVLNYNDEDGLRKCLKSLEPMVGKSPLLEVLVVDNNSADGSRRVVSNNPWSRLIESETNLGCAGGRNLGWANAKGEIVFFVDSDAEVADGCVAAVAEFFAEDSRVGVVGCVVKDPGDRTTVSEAGMSIDRFGFMIFFYEREQSLAPFYVSGCSFAVRRELALDLGVFDDRYFIFEEEIDLCWRYQLAGYRVAVAHDAVVYHRAGTNFKGGPVSESALYTTSRSRVYLRERNALATMLKNYSARSLLVILPLYLVALTGEALVALVTLRLGWSMQCVKAVIWNALNLRGTLARRRRVQETRVVGDRDLPFDPRFGKWLGFRQIGLPSVR